MKKEDLRKEYHQIRNSIEDKITKDTIIFNKVINNQKILTSKSILIYVSLKEEIDTINLIKHFLNNKKVAVPKIENNQMNFYYITSLFDLKPGYFNILEPTTNNMVTDFTNTICITPGICFSKDGYRIGYGKGFYDKFLSQNKIPSIGLCYKECLIDYIPTNKYDQKVDEVITD